jgi:hypothetical protein
VTVEHDLRLARLEAARLRHVILALQRQATTNPKETVSA